MNLSCEVASGATGGFASVAPPRPCAARATGESPAADAIEAAAMTTAIDDRDKDQEDRICEERGCACFIEPSCLRWSAKSVGNGAADSGGPRIGAEPQAAGPGRRLNTTERLCRRELLACRARAAFGDWKVIPLPPPLRVGGDPSLTLPTGWALMCAQIHPSRRRSTGTVGGQNERLSRSSSEPLDHRGEVHGHPSHSALAESPRPSPVSRNRPVSSASSPTRAAPYCRASP